MISDTDKRKFSELLVKLGIPAEQVKVFGGSQICVHVICRSRATADRWSMALATIEPGRKISCVRHFIERKKFKRDSSLQAHIRGWLVSL